MRRTLAAAITAVATFQALVLAAAPSATAIVGGTPARTPYPGTGSLQLDDHGDPNWHSCGVTQLTAEWALTNAHCVTNMPTPGQVEPMSPKGRATLAQFRATAQDTPGIDRTDPAIYHLRFGSTDRLAGGVVRRLDRIDVPSGWRWGEPDAAGRIWDIALLHLSAPVYSVPPALIAPVLPWRPSAREIGWGMTTPDSSTWNHPAPRYLAQVDVPVVASSECAEAGIGTGEVCLGASANHGGACEGDSGSAALQRIGTQWVVIGTTSRGIASDHCGTANVYTSPIAFLSWLIPTMRRLEPHAAITAAPTAIDASAA